MAIEFHCPHCDKYLKTKEDKAGRGADCPGCGERITVPEISDFQYQDPTAGLEGEIDYGEVEVVDRDTKICPICGGEIKAAAVKCKHCGEEFGSVVRDDGNIHPTKIELENVMSTAWTAYKSNAGICIGIGLVSMLINGFVAGVLSGIQEAITGGGDDAGAIALIVLVNLLSNAFQLWLNMGHMKFALKIMRGQDGSITDLFSAGPEYLTGLGASILFGLAVTLATLAFIIPGIYLALMWWPYLFLIVDRDVEIGSSFSLAKEITEGNKMTVFALGLLATVLMFGGLLACCIGVIFVAPYITLMWATTYLKMSGQGIHY